MWCATAREVALQASTTHLYEHRMLVDAASRQGIPLRQPGEPLGVCIMTADFWGAPTAGGTATAYHLLAEVIWMELEALIRGYRSGLLRGST